MGALCTMGLGTWGIPVRGNRKWIPWGLRARSCNRNPNVLALKGPDSRKCGAEPRRGGRLVRFAPLLFAQSLPRKRFFGPAFLAGLHVEAMLLDFLDDVFLLHLALKTAQGIFQRFTLLDNDFSHLLIHPQSGSDWFLAAPLAGQATAGCARLRAPPLVLIIARIVRFADAPRKVAGLF